MANEREALEKAVEAYSTRFPSNYRVDEGTALIDAANAYLKATEQPKSRWLDADPADCNDADASGLRPVYDRDLLDVAIRSLEIDTDLSEATQWADLKTVVLDAAYAAIVQLQAEVQALRLAEIQRLGT